MTGRTSEIGCTLSILAEGPLLRALRYKRKPCVLLIDELDKVITRSKRCYWKS